MNVCFLSSDPRINSEDLTGAGSHIRKDIKAFEKSGIKVLPLVAGDLTDITVSRNIYRKAANLPKILLNAKILIRDLYEILDDHRSRKRYKKIIGATKCDFIYERKAVFRSVGLNLSKSMKVPLILEMNDPSSEILRFYPSILKKYASNIERRQLENACGIIVGSQMLADYTSDIIGNSNKIKVVYPTADYDKFVPSDGLLNGKFTDSVEIGFIGSMKMWHRVDLLLRAFCAALNVNKNLSLKLIGDGPESANLKKLANILKIIDKVEFLGNIPYEKIPSLIDNLDVCVIPYATWYGSPTKLFEYGIMGKAVIGPLNTPVQEIITDGVNGKLVDLGSEKDLEAALLYLCGNEKIRTRLGTNLRQKLLSDITWSQNVTEILSLLPEK